MSLVFIGLGIFDVKDIPVKGLERARECDRLFAEFYTSRLMGSSVGELEDFLGCEVEVLGRDAVESSDLILDCAEEGDVGFLVVGDSMIATTHNDIRLRALKRDIETEVVHASSIYTAAPGLAGLQNYKFGRSATVAFPYKGNVPRSGYKAVRENRERGLHTLLFLDIKEDGFMSPSLALECLLEVEREVGDGVVGDDLPVVVVGRAGSDDPMVRAGRLGELVEVEWGDPMHVLIVPGDLHFLEEEALEFFGLD
ncbi:diphthine synthase [Methanonatronarchaeum sp. AMET6-2]|uniref:diphthine synthase n=1 Tax=Methanonatronarchaeum sp. AMET6-2 TaxID=2933293 RepID=UPI0011F8DE8E|nr:diphthine synthase [Methanonatronarchaeum sp. AMET6-2]RZN62644.1 MAG: diphthine synthase [Methanonatronarchaeia archaeon]UOY10046.1 diphthine synthase [Methanonatronarchaeum sp. AMET6-2]